MSFFRAGVVVLVTFLFAVSYASAKSWDLAVYQVEEDLFEPTYQAALSEDSRKLAVVIEKLAALADKGDRVKKIYHDTLTRKVISTDSHLSVGVNRMVPKRVYESFAQKKYMGSKLEWTLLPIDDAMEHYRKLEFSYLGDPRSHYKLEVELYSSLPSHWTITAGIRLEKGGVFVFEKIGEGLDAPNANGPWFTACCAAEKPKKAEELLDTWWKAPLRPAFFLRKAVGHGGNVLEFERNRLFEGCPNTIKTKSKFGSTHGGEKAAVEMSLNSVIEEKPRSFQAFLFESRAQWDMAPLMISPKTCQKKEGVYVSSGKGKLRSEDYKKPAVIRLNLIQP